MRHIFILLFACFFLGGDSMSQASWFGGVSWSTSPRIQRYRGEVGLQTMRDHHWQLGVERSIEPKRFLKAVGCLSSLQFRSIYYELDRPLSYYPLKVLIPAFRLESVQVNPFISWGGGIRGLSRVGWSFRLGPVFNFHGGNYSSITMARSVSDGQPFELYRLGVYRQPMGLPFIRSQVLLSYSVKRFGKWECCVQPFMQLDIGDRSRAWYRAVSDDPLYVSEGWIRTGSGSFGLSCSLVSIH